MRSNPPALAPILRSRTQAGVLAVTLLNPEQEYTLTDLANRLEVSLSSVHDEVRRLEQAEILTSRQLGRARLVRAGSGPMVEPLTQLIQIAFGPKEVISDEFAGIPGIDELMLFGSWAARYHDVAGPAPKDIDVLVVATGSTVDRAQVYAAAERAERRLARPVNPTVITSRRWAAQSPDDALLQEISTRPVVKIPLPRTDTKS